MPQLLEVVDDPHKVVTALAATLRPGGVASVVVANRAAAVLAEAIGGHLAAAALLVASPDGRGDARDRLRRRYDVDTATALLSGCGLAVEQIHGVRIIADLVPGSVAESEHEALQAFELALAGTSPYRDIATQLHLLARRRDLMGLSIRSPPRYGQGSLAEVMPSVLSVLGHAL